MHLQPHGFNNLQGPLKKRQDALAHSAQGSGRRNVHNSGDSIVAVTPNDDTDSEYIYHYLGYIRSHLEDIAPQSAQKNINLRILSELPIPRLHLQEQRRIVSYLDDLQATADSLKDLQQAAKKELDALMPSILSKAFSGEL